MPEKVFIFESAVAGIFSAEGDAGRFNRKVTREIAFVARAIAPKRTTNLARSHRTFGPTRRGRYWNRGFVTNTAEHSLWVHNGTRTPITRPGGGLMRIPVSSTRAAVLSQPGSDSGAVYRRAVRGQRANPWLDRAGRTVAARYR